MFRCTLIRSARCSQAPTFRLLEPKPPPPQLVYLRSYCYHRTCPLISPDNPPPPDTGPPGPQLTEVISPPPQPCDRPAPSSEPTTCPEATQSFTQALQLLEIGPCHEVWNLGIDWFAFAAPFAAVIGKGYESLCSLSSDKYPQLTQHPSFPQANAILTNNLRQAAASTVTQEKKFNQHLQNWINNEIKSLRNGLMPAITANVERWREQREAELMEKASKEAEFLVSLRKEGSAQCRSRDKSKGNSPPSPSAHRDPSTLGKRSLGEATDRESDTEMSDGSSSSLHAQSDVSRTPRAKRVAYFSSSSNPTPPYNPPAEPLLASIDALFSQRFDPILQRLSALKKRSNPLGASLSQTGHP